MLTLIHKDLRVVGGFGWLIAWLVAVFYLVPAMAAAQAGGSVFWVDVAFAAAAIVGVGLLDARSGADRFIHSLPVTRAEVVRARYGTACILTVVVLCLGVGVGVTFGLASVSRAAAWPRWFAPDVGVAFLGVMAVFIAVYLPCYFRWGYGAGTVVAALLIAAFVIAGDVAGGLLSTGAGAAPSSSGLPRGLVVRMTVAAVERWGLVTASIAAAAAAAALLTASAALASRACRYRQF